MSSQFEFVNDLNKEFLEYFYDGHRTLCRKCMDYEASVESAPDDCLRNVRSLNEDIMKFLYKFLFSKEWDGNFSSLLKNAGFKDAVNNRTLINKSDLIRETGNSQVHTDRKESIDVLQEAQDAISNLKYVIENVHKIYEKGKPEKAETTETARERIKGDIEIKIGKHVSEGHDQLEVTLRNTNFDIRQSNRDREIEYHWKFKNSTAEGFNRRTPYFKILDHNYGRTIILTVKHDKFSGYLRKTFLIERDKKPAESLPALKGEVVLEKKYNVSNGKPYLYAAVKGSNAKEPFLFRWGYKQGDGQVFFNPPSGVQPKENNNINWLNEKDSKGNSFIGKEILCLVTRDGYDRKGIVSHAYFPLKPDDFKYQIIGVLKVERDIETNTLVASLEDSNIGDETPQFSWSIDGSEYTAPGLSAKYELTDESSDRVFTCKSTCAPNFVGEVVSAPFEMKGATTPEPEPISEPLPEPMPEPEPEPIPEPEPLIRIPSVFEPAEARDYKPIHYFQSIRGQIQYFACNYDDSYVLNSYEKLDYSNFLYRFLKEQGFDRIVTVEKREGKYDLFAFDKLSELSFANPAEFRNVKNIKDSNGLSRFYDGLASGRPQLTRPGKAVPGNSRHSSGAEMTASKDNVPELGKRRINLPSITSREIFQSTVNQYICPALRAKNARTCIVLPVGLLVTNEYLSPQIASLINSALRDAKKEVAKNVLLITASRTEDFNAIMEQSYTLFSELEPEINKAYVNAGNGDRFGSVLVRQLEERNRILIADEYPHADEIANTFFKKIIIDEDALVSKLSYTKIYTLADYIYKSDEFNSIINEILGLPEGTNKLTVDFLESILTNKTIVEALLKKSESLKDRQPVKYNNLPSTYVSRVVGDIERSFISKEEREEELNDILLEMDELVGMEDVKRQVLEQMNSMESDLRRLDERKIRELPYQNMMFVGPPGTGKTTVAELAARLMCAKGILPKQTMLKRTPAYYNNTGTVGILRDALQADIESAAGGVILFDEFYNFNQGHSAGNLAKDALAAIMEGADKYKGRICIIIAGYEKQVMETLAFNPGADRRFPSTNRIEFSSYSTSDIVEIFRRHVIASGFKEPTEKVLRAIEPVIDAERAEKRDEFANAGFVTDTLFPAIRRKYDASGALDDTITVQHIIKAFPSFKRLIMNPGNAVDDILAEFDGLVGMASVKQQIIEQMEVMKYNLNEHKKGKMKELPYQNMMFVGPQGTGKTTVACLVARLFAASGILPKRTPVIKSPRNYTNTGTVGALRDALQKDIDSAEGGVILFDEFYDFNQGHSAGNMANDALAAIMEGADKYKGRICIIIAGYEKQVMETLAFNPGAERRFPSINKITFSQLSTSDIVEIFRRHAISNGFKEPDKKVLDAVAIIVDNEKREKGDRFTNGGFVKDTVFEAIKRKYIMRKGTDYVFTVEDVQKAFPNMEVHSSSGTPLKKYSRLEKNVFNNLAEPNGGIVKGDEKQIKKQDRNTIIRLRTDANRIGTGFFIHPAGYAITCNHVICDANGNEADRITAKVFCYRDDDIYEEEVSARIVFRDKHIDMALLQIDTDSAEYKAFLEKHYDGSLPYLMLVPESNKIKDLTGDAAVLMGFPNGKESIQTSDANISGRTINPVGIECYTTMENAYGGNSGGPIISVDSGRVVGILTGSVKDKTTGKGTEGDNYILPINYFWKDMVR